MDQDLNAAMAVMNLSVAHREVIMQIENVARVIVVSLASVALVYFALIFTAAGGNYGSNENNGGQTSSRMGDREGVTTSGDGGRFGYSPVGNQSSIGRGGWGYGRSSMSLGPGGKLTGGV